MCGLVGILSSNVFIKHKDCLSSLLYLDTWRGRDSTGVAAVRHNGDTAILKSTVPGYEFIEGNKLDQHLRLNDFCWIGHNRYGTVGRNIKTNSHPFEILDEDGTCLLVGAHNGTLKNKHVLQDHQQFGTDSEALLNEIALTSLKDTLAKVEGAWALTYYDHDEEELHFIRNKERPLCFAFEEGRKTMVWASESWMLKIAMSRHGLKMDQEGVIEVQEDTLYRFPAPMKMNEELSYKTEGGLVGKTPSFFQTVWERNRERTSGTVSGTQQKATTETRTSNPQPRTSQTSALALGTSTTSSTQSGTSTSKLGERLNPARGSSSAPSKSNVTSIDTAKTFKGYQGTALSKTEIENQLANGCGWCEINFIDLADKFAWLAPGKAVCHKCLTGTHEPGPEASYAIH